MLNHITIMGRLTKDPELRKTQSGVSVVTFTVAVDRDFKNGDEKVTDYIDCTAWRGQADFIAKYFGKGRMIVVDGALNSRKWTDKDGNNRVSWEIQAQNVYFGDSKRNDDGQQSNANNNSGNLNAIDAKFGEITSDNGEELPF